MEMRVFQSFLSACSPIPTSLPRLLVVPTKRVHEYEYIAKFGLAVHIKEELVSKVNKSPFVLMFDESLNETTKNKQLDVRFWDEGQVQSRYLGSQFIGHSTAQVGRTVSP